MKKQRMYKTLAKYYDQLYNWKDYQKEVQAIKDLIATHKKSPGKELLDVGCGTGSHLKYLVDEYNCFGVDINSEMLAIAKEKVVAASFIRGDMAKLNLGKQFDVILCLFSSIGYVKTEKRLMNTIEGFACHLKQGGVLFIEPWLTKESYRAGSPHITVFDGEKLKIARVNISEIKGNLSVFDMHYLIAEQDKQVTHFVDRHELAFFPVELIISLMEEKGLTTSFLKEEPFEGRGLCIGVKSY